MEYLNHLVLFITIGIVLSVLITKIRTPEVSLLSEEMYKSLGLGLLIGLWVAGLLMFLGLKINI